MQNNLVAIATPHNIAHMPYTILMPRLQAVGCVCDIANAPFWFHWVPCSSVLESAYAEIKRYKSQ